MGPRVFIKDGKDVPNPEDMAMLQGLYSRNPASVETRMHEIGGSRGPELMSTYYVGYGHASIGECGDFTIFLEGISLIAAKAVQSHQLYRGQESSTRYLDFASQGHFGIDDIQPQWLEIYEEALLFWKAFFAEENPYEKYSHGCTEKVWQRAVDAAAFDKARGWLPIGVKTNVSWTTNFRTCLQHLRWMYAHPLSEIRSIAFSLFQALAVKYPNSFPNELTAPTVIQTSSSPNDFYVQPIPLNYVYNQSSMTSWSQLLEELVIQDVTVVSTFREYADRSVPARVVRDRGDSISPKLNKELPWLNNFLIIDYGSYRDFQRHRHMEQTIPLVTLEEIGGTPRPSYHHWYLRDLPRSLTNKISSLTSQIKERQIFRTLSEQIEQQYMYPLATLVAVRYQCSVDQAIYLVETRTSRMVHPTLRYPMLVLGEFLKKHLHWIEIHIDNYPQNTFEVRRGNQTIERRSTETPPDVDAV